jgi:hypothetical protein
MGKGQQPWCHKKKKAKGASKRNSINKSYGSGSRIDKARLSDPNGNRMLKGNADLNVLNDSEYESQYYKSGDTKKTAVHLRSVDDTQRMGSELNEIDKKAGNSSGLNSPDGEREVKMTPGL